SPAGWRRFIERVQAADRHKDECLAMISPPTRRSTATSQSPTAEPGPACWMVWVVVRRAVCRSGQQRPEPLATAQERGQHQHRDAERATTETAFERKVNDVQTRIEPGRRPCLRVQAKRRSPSGAADARQGGGGAFADVRILIVQRLLEFGGGGSRLRP